MTLSWVTGASFLLVHVYISRRRSSVSFNDPRGTLQWGVWCPDGPSNRIWTEPREPVSTVETIDLLPVEPDQVDFFRSFARSADGQKHGLLSGTPMLRKQTEGRHRTGLQESNVTTINRCVSTLPNTRAGPTDRRHADRRIQPLAVSSSEAHQLRRITDGAERMPRVDDALDRRIENVPFLAAYGRRAGMTARGRRWRLVPCQGSVLGLGREMLAGSDSR